MNIKRAFLTAAAVLMVPGFAMAQDANTFPTLMNGPDAGMPDMTITCNAGLPLTQTAPVGTTFSVTDLVADNVCTVAMAGDVDSGYEATGYTCDTGEVLADMAGCKYTMAETAAAYTTTVNVAASPVMFSVDVDWDISEDADPGVGDSAMVEIMCMGMYGYTSTTQPADPDADMPVTITLVPDVDGTSYCNAELTNVGSAVDANSCMEVDIEVGEDASCAIMATAFYEGIPTLSQYGMAIMVLLMLGVGFVGFRRFV